MGEQQIEPFAYQKSTNIDEHNQIVDKVNEIVGVINGVELDEVNNKITALQSAVATNTTDIATNASDIDSLADTVDAQATSIATNKTNIESLRDANIIITKDIESIKETDTEQNASITALDNADIATATSEFDNTARKLTITLNPKSGDAITAETIIPASGETGDDYTATAPIAIANKDISLAIDTDTMEITTDGKLKSKADGKTYVAGSGISIDDTTNAISVDETVIATKATTDNLDTQIKECATGVANAITQAQTAKSTADDAYTHANTCYNDVAIADNVLTFTTVEGDTKNITLPSRNIKLPNTIITDYYNPITLNLYVKSKYASGMTFSKIGDGLYHNDGVFANIGYMLDTKDSPTIKDNIFYIDADSLISAVTEYIDNNIAFSKYSYSVFQTRYDYATVYKTFTLKLKIFTINGDYAGYAMPYIQVVHNNEDNSNVVTLSDSSIWLYVENGTINSYNNVKVVFAVESVTYTK